MLPSSNAFPLEQPKLEPSVKKWLQQRQDLLILYGQLCETSCVKPETLESFCQTLVDYLSAGHFQVFEVLAKQQNTLEPDLLERIAMTTDFSLDFNEKYTDPTSLEHLLQDLSVLGEHLANRMDWEDKILEPYFSLGSL